MTLLARLSPAFLSPTHPDKFPSKKRFPSLLLCFLADTEKSFLLNNVEWGRSFISHLIHDSYDAIIENFINNFIPNRSSFSFISQIKIRMWEIGEWKDGDAETLCNGELTENGALEIWLSGESREI